MQQTNFTNKQLEIINKAYTFAKRNVYVLPGEIGKKYPRNGLIPGCPTVSYNIKDYPDVGFLVELFKKYPDSNIIKLNGNGFLSVVIDIDKKDGKFSNEALAIIDLLKDYPTYVTETPSGGLHYHYIIDPKRLLVGRITGYKPGVDIILDGSTPLPPSKAWSNKINAEGEYTERDSGYVEETPSGDLLEINSIEINPPTLFPYELFPDLVDTLENKEKYKENKKQRIQEQLDKGEITEYRNDTFHHLTVALIAKFPNNPRLVWGFIKWLYDNHANKEDFPLIELETTFNSALNGKVASEARAKTLDDIDTAGFGSPSVVFWNQLKDLKLPETSFLVDNLVVERGINYIYGKPGVCKTWIALYLALCIARGIPAFGKFLTRQCKILFVDKDNDLYQMRLRVESLDGLNTDQVGYYCDSALFRVENEDAVNKLLACIKEHGFGLVVFDTARDIHKGEEDSSTHMDRVNQVFKRILHEGCAVLAISHTKKKEEGDLIDLMRGSTAIAGSAASMIHVKQPDENTVVLEIGKSRYAKKIPPIELKILHSGSSITGFEYTGIARVEPENEDKKDLVVENILKLIKGVSGITRKELIQAIQKNGYPSESTIDRTIAVLVTAGVIKKVGEGKDMIIKEKLD